MNTLLPKTSKSVPKSNSKTLANESSRMESIDLPKRMRRPVLAMQWAQCGLAAMLAVLVSAPGVLAQFPPAGGGYVQTPPTPPPPANYTPLPPSQQGYVPPQPQGYIPSQPLPQGYVPAPAPQGYVPAPAPQGYVPAPAPQTVVPFPPTQFGPRVRQRVMTPGTAVPGDGNAYPPIGTAPVYSPNVRVADLIVKGFPARTGRIMFGGAVNSDAGITGQITVDERNFDILRWPRSFSDLFGGTAFRGAGQTFRVEAAPGSYFDRYSMQFADPNLFGYLPISFSASGFLYDRRFDDWDENRLGGRLALGYRITPDLSLSVGIGGQNVKIDNIRVPGVSPELDAVNGENKLYSGSVSLTHNTRDSPIQPSEGHFFEFQYKQTFGDFDYARFDVEYRKYWLLSSRADGSGKQTLSFGTQLGFSGDQTPVFENYFAGGYATMRGFDFRGASPVVGGPNGVEVGGQFQFLNSVEYMFPITADDAFRGVAFCDFGTVEQTAKLDADTFRVAPGVGLRVAIPALGPAPLAFDFAFPVAKAEYDNERMFSFYMSVIR